jgi:transcriptional antiterminator RfaH
LDQSWDSVAVFGGAERREDNQVEEMLGQSLDWYAIYTKPREEERACQNLNAWKIQTFAPKVSERVYHRYTEKTFNVIKPLFPRYIFARFHPQLGPKVSFTRGVQSIVSFSGKLVPLEDEIIEAIRSRMENGLVHIGEEFEPGDEVVIRDGPLKSFKGVFEHKLKGTDRVRILLTTISYQANIVVDRDLVASAR